MDKKVVHNLGFGKGAVWKASEDALVIYNIEADPPNKIIELSSDQMHELAEYWHDGYCPVCWAEIPMDEDGQPHHLEAIEERRKLRDEALQRLAKVPDLLAALEETLDQLCRLCRRLNPQHADCTWCQDTEQARAAVAAARGGEAGE